MNSSTLASSSSSSSLFQFKLTPTKPTQPSLLRFTPPHSQNALKVTASTNPHSILQTAKQYAKAAILIGVTATVFHNSSKLLARADPPPPATLTEEEAAPNQGQNETQASPLSDFLGSNSDAVDALKSLLQQKLENGEDDEALKILQRLAAAQPSVTEWKFLMARVLSEMGETGSARQVFEEILESNPLSFEALFENALLMDRSGEGHAVIRRLEEALAVAEEENKAKEARDVKLIMAQIQFLQKNVEDALSSYNELVKEDPKDFRPYFCRGMIYSLLERNEEAKEQFEKYRQLSPKKFEVDGYLMKPLSRIKLFGSDEN
ncbi:putative tetratricopeptide-like helical domain-containing protein [Rosa chinensis]|uniref:Putative tetratricopeptide-like helical domain-containing protein n=1 Tax=Rosa chinensis TaxID=74649 RepID=A0A2P6R4I6_ROSCH|nr:protein SLOW GREEN 1, chloroplastic isoform X1 [Rosa chinensis]PRQ41357.1 putative tetratricopeptide-like helical domain-containing protein [Rosa chinensis]